MVHIIIVVCTSIVLIPYSQLYYYTYMYIAHVIMRACMFTCGLHIHNQSLYLALPASLVVERRVKNLVRGCSAHSFKPFTKDYIKYLTYLYYPNYIHIYLYIDFLIIFLTINPNPPCQLSLWEETGENPRLLAQC